MVQLVKTQILEGKVLLHRETGIWNEFSVEIIVSVLNKIFIRHIGLVKFLKTDLLSNE